MLTPHQIDEIRRRLLKRSEEVLADIRRELRKSDNQTYAQLADRVADSGDQSVADLLVDVNLAEITRDVQEVRDLEAALMRLAVGQYGSCVDCEEPIKAERLDLNPAAARCIRCQQAFEMADRQTHLTSL